jgi:hypothetical protein
MTPSSTSSNPFRSAGAAARRTVRTALKSIGPKPKSSRTWCPRVCRNGRGSFRAGSGRASSDTEEELGSKPRGTLQGHASDFVPGS